MSKSEADWCKKIEIWWLLKGVKETSGYKRSTVSWGENGSHGSITVEVSIWGDEKYARFLYSQTDNNGEKKDFDYKVPIIETPCHFGGSRYWFQCSLYKAGKYCGRRVGVLYKDGDWFGCRHCYELTYSSRNKDRRYKHYPTFRVLELHQQIDKLEEKAKRYTYNGKPTKKRKRLEKLYRQTMFYISAFRANEKGIDFDVSRGRDF